MVPDVQHTAGLSITLSHATPTGPWLAVAVVVTKAQHRHRITFSADLAMEEVFCPEIVNEVAPILASFTGGNSVYSNPDLEINVPGLSMRQLRVIYSYHEGEPSRALIRFAAFAGNPQRALITEDDFSAPLDSLANKIFRDALDRVLMPALNIASIDEVTGFNESHRDHLDDAMLQLRRSKEQLMFQVELVKRELGRLEAHSYTQQRTTPMGLAAEPPQEDFRTLRVIREMG